MASPSPSNPTPESHEDLSPSLRARLEQLFRFGEDKLKIGDRDYANSMFSQCVAKDPSNLKYVEAFFDNLNAKFESQKKKVRVKENRSAFKKALAAEEWKRVIKEGLTLLKDHPWDTATLRGMAEACAALHFNEVELRYLKNALDGNPKDVDVNRHCATSLARMGQYDQAIACWHRIEDKVKSEALKNISDLTMAKSRPSTGMAEDEVQAASSKPKVAGRSAAPEAAGNRSSSSKTAASEEDAGGTRSEAVQAPVTQAELEAAIVRQPDDIENYLKLADVHDAAGRYREAEQVLRRVLPVSGGDLAIRERLEKAQIRRSKSNLLRAEKEAQADPSEEKQQQVERARRHHNRLELEVYDARAQRYPEDRALQYELGVRLKRAGNFEEAVPYFQKAREDDRCRASALLAEGECLQQMRQYKAALAAYQEAAQAPSGNEMALYRAGVLATGLKDYARAKSWLTRLVEIDPDFRDAAVRLDKLP